MGSPRIGGQSFLLSLRVLWSCSELGLTNNTPFLNGFYFTIIVDICFACFRENSIV